ncbi:MAG: citrate synthase [Candidatus Sericytochromatia bacterium]
MSEHPGLEGIVAAETRLSDVRGEAGELIVAGWKLSDLVAHHDYAGVAALLWAEPPAEAATAAEIGQALGQARVLAWETLQPLSDALAKREALPALQLGLSLCGTRPELQTPAGLSAVLGLALVLHLQPEAPRPDPAAEHVGDLLRLIQGQAPPPTQVAALTSYLVTVADHGLNASTFAARVIASTASDAASCVLGALGALKGPLHGGAPGPVLDMLDAIGEPEHTRAWVQGEWAAGRRLMGFGHRIYRVRDPRADVLKAALAHYTLSLTSSNPLARTTRQRLERAEAIEKHLLEALAVHKPERRLDTNVEFYTALLLEALGFQRQSFTALFALGRVLGWLAHIQEQRKTGRLIRPASRYIGP